VHALKVTSGRTKCVKATVVKIRTMTAGFVTSLTMMLCFCVFTIQNIKCSLLEATTVTETSQNDFSSDDEKDLG
jgi:hypothetical protein